MRGFALYTADCAGVETNCSYPHRMIVTDNDTLKEAAGHDYVCVDYKNRYRSNANFISSNCLGMDCDNDHSDTPEDWITPESIRHAFPDVTFAVHYSRHNNIPKRGKSPRPKFHCLFQIDEMTDPVQYSDLKKRIYGIFPYFDTQALDAARFFFGTDQPDVEFFPGTLTLNECLDSYYPDSEENPESTPLDEPYTAYARTIPEGSRNATMSHFAGRVLKRYGDTEQAHALFLEKAEKCVPPLPDTELSTIWRSARGFYSRIQQQPGYVPPEEYNAPDVSYEPEDYTDVGQATILAKTFGNRLRYSPYTDYLAYNGVYWEEYRPAAQAMIHELTQLQLEEAQQRMEAAWQRMTVVGAAEIVTNLGKKKAEAMFNEEQRQAYDEYARALAYHGFAMKRRDSKYITAAMLEARPMLTITPKELDADCFLLCTPAATYDLRKGAAGAQEHKAEDYLTKVTSVSPDSESDELWQAALNTFFCGDTGLIRYVQMIAGLASIGKVFFEAMVIAYGDGRNGKSTFWNVIARVLGLYSGNISADSLTAGCRRNVKPEMAEAKGKRLLIAAELEEGTRLNTSTIKQLTSTDDVFAEKKYKDPFAYTPSHTLVLYTNHLPRVGALDEGTWRRLIVIPFKARIQGNSDIKNYAEYLYEKAGGAILTWIIEGARMVIELDYKIPEPACVTAAIKAYREANDWLAHFLDERCEVGADLHTSSGELYVCYRNYCAETGEYTRSTTDFYAALDNAGYKRKKTRAGIMISGMRVKTMSDEAAFPDFLK